MPMANLLRRTAMASVATALIGGLGGSVVAHPAPIRHAAGSHMAHVAPLPPGTQRPTAEVLLSIGEGELITLPSAVADVWVSNPGVADVYVNNPHQIHLFGKEFGQATVFATSASGAVIYSTGVRVSQNITSVDKMLKLAMPEADIKVITAGQIAVLTGTVATPDDVATAKQLVTSVLNPGIDPSSGAPLKIAVISRLKTATPLQVNLQVRIAEVSRSFVKNIGSNLLTRDTTGGFNFGVSSGGRLPGTIGQLDTSGYPQVDVSSQLGLPAGTVKLPLDVSTGKLIDPSKATTYALQKGAERTTLGLAGHLLGLDVLEALDLGERTGQVTTLSNPNVTALSGETATFLAGGEIPIPVSQGLGAVSVEYKQYGVSLAYTPTVLSDGRISLRVRPEVSELSSQGAVSIGGTTIPALTTRRVETTAELGSGQSLVIGGLLQNSHNNSFDKTPGVGDLPVLGALFRSNAYQRNETELVIVITPYLVKPVNANDVHLPTDGYKAPSDIDRVFMGQLSRGTTGGERPKPSMAPSPDLPAGPVQPAIGATAPVSPTPGAPAAPAPRDERRSARKAKGASIAPGFSSN